ncbi:GNAT family N-acetyltransferase [Blastococcus sp. TF02-8]|uniref:GNAT family N-acetyltransferase n=1 Tax=Blastococcus sp. TF02-8 TaxID=2250574 RepID=UPI000DEBE418|nr:GNAT family N-acetyltransferase [Blastococcus sp. TF02-8]RBY97635.1 GNAT family N-acetyltransferase [Blastococcus sp. TF02-8]
MPELVPPTVALEAAWRTASEEWWPGRHEDGFGLLPSDDVASPRGFAAWVARLLAEEDPAGAGPRCTYRWVVEGGEVLGGIALRHSPPADQDHLGHVGYGIRPSARGRGLAGWALGRMLGEARRLGLEQVLVVCSEENLASARTVERLGGRLLEVVETPLGRARRYSVGIS